MVLKLAIIKEGTVLFVNVTYCQQIVNPRNSNFGTVRGGYYEISKIFLNGLLDYITEE
jgi:hypothetical protein